MLALRIRWGDRAVAGVVTILGRGKKIKGAAAAVGLTTTLRRGGGHILTVSVSNRTGLARSFNLSVRRRRAICKTVGNGCPLPLIRATKNMAIMPSYLSLSTTRTRLVGRPKQRLVLGNLVNGLLRGQGFSCVLVSYPPSLKLLALGTLATTSCLVVPMRTRFLTVHNVTGVVGIVTAIRRHLGPGLTVNNVMVARFSGHGALGGDITRLIGSSFYRGIFGAIVQSGMSLTRTPVGNGGVFRCDEGDGKTGSCVTLTRRMLGLGWSQCRRRQFARERRREQAKQITIACRGSCQQGATNDDPRKGEGNNSLRLHRRRGRSCPCRVPHRRRRRITRERHRQNGREMSKRRQAVGANVTATSTRPKSNDRTSFFVHPLFP